MRSGHIIIDSKTTDSGSEHRQQIIKSATEVVAEVSAAITSAREATFPKWAKNTSPGTTSYPAPAC